MIITAKSGLTVDLSESEYGDILLRAGSIAAAKYLILSTAGRVHKHRRTLLAYAQQTITAEQHEAIEALAVALIRQWHIDQRMIDLGYGNYIARRDQGGRLPDSYAVIRERAAAGAGDAPPVDDRARVCAMKRLGLLTQDDADWSSRITTGYDWTITAPAGWDRETEPTLTTASA